MMATVYLEFEDGTLYEKTYYWPDNINPIGMGVSVPTRENTILKVGEIAGLILLTAFAYLGTASVEHTSDIADLLVRAGWSKADFSHLDTRDIGIEAAEEVTSDIPIIETAYFRSTMSNLTLMGMLDRRSIAMTSTYNGFVIGLRREGGSVRYVRATSQGTSPTSFHFGESTLEEVRSIATRDNMRAKRPGNLISQLLKEKMEVLSTHEALSFLGIREFKLPPPRSKQE